MKIYLVWARVSYCEYDVICVLESQEEAEKFINENVGKIDNNYLGTLDEGDLWIEEREIGVKTEPNW